MKHNYDAFDDFRKWKDLVKNKTGLKVKCLQSEKGGH